MPLIVILWSFVMTCTGVVKTGGQLIAVRVLLGLLECGLFPGVSFLGCTSRDPVTDTPAIFHGKFNFIFTCWYTREEQGKRAALFFAGASLASAFSEFLEIGCKLICSTYTETLFFRAKVAF